MKITIEIDGENIPKINMENLSTDSQSQSKINQPSTGTDVNAGKALQQHTSTSLNSPDSYSQASAEEKPGVNSHGQGQSAGAAAYKN